MVEKTRRRPLRPSRRYSSRDQDPRHFRIFVASPGDVTTERDIVTLVGHEIERTLAFGPVPLVKLEVVRWETHAWPDVGDDAQDVINREVGEHDLFVGIMWRRFGTPTGRAESGTEEEFNRAYAYYKAFGRPRIMMYFRREPFYPASMPELLQFSKVLEFKERLGSFGTLYWEYLDSLAFERFLREHLTKQVLMLTTQLARSR